MRLLRSALDRRSFVFGGIAGSAMIAAAPHAYAVADAAGKVARLKGTADATGGGPSRQLAPSMPIYVADNVRTGADSRLGLQLGAQTTINLGASTQIKIDRFLVGAGGTIDLVDGAMMYEHDGPPAGEVEFRSPYGLIAVRGTRFYAGPSNGVFGVLVSTGHVVVTAAGKSVSVRPQEGVDIAAPGAPPSDPKTWGLGRIRAMQAAVR